MTACAQEATGLKTTAPDASNDQRVPVTVLAGFLGSGKTTLLNRILSEEHGKRIAVIENEYGEIGIDHELVVQSDEEIFEMNNGCICCTVRGDLIRILGRLMRRKHKFDHIIIETTGMADPGPVAQTFFMDEEMKAKLRLVSTEDLMTVEQQVRDLNRLAKLHRTVQARIGIEELLGIRAFDLEARAAEMPEFLREELPFEWGGLFDLAPGKYQLRLRPGPDPTIDLVLGGPGLQDAAIFDAWKRESIVLYSGDPQALGSDSAMQAGEWLYRLPVDETAGATAAIEITAPGRYVLFTQHLPEEFALALCDASGAQLEAAETFQYASPHEHDDTVGSIGICLQGDLDPERFEAWMVDLLRRRGTDIFRTKGVLNLAGNENRFVFQGVHMLFDGQDGRPWEADGTRESQLVFIGRDLDRTELAEGLRRCLA